MRRILLTLVLIGVWSPLQAAPTGSLEFSTHRRIIDFGITYPLLKLESDVERRGSGFQKHLGAGGVTYNYQFYWGDHLGLSINPAAWFIRTRSSGKNKTLYSLNIEAGPSFRVLPSSYFDPMLNLTSGVARMGGGGANHKNKLTYPFTAKGSLNLWRQRQPFQDHNLAFSFSTAFRYHLNEMTALSQPWMLEFGLAFRGSF